MSFVATPGLRWPFVGGSSNAWLGLAIDAAAEKVAFIVQAPKTGTLDKFECKLGTVTQAPASGLKFSFQDLTITTGAPDDNADEYRTLAAGLTGEAWIVPGLMTDDGTDNGAKRSVTQGEWLACVVEFDTFAGGDSLEIDTFQSSTVEYKIPVFHYIASWVQKAANYAGNLALLYDDGVYYDLGSAYAYASRDYYQLNSGSTPDEAGIKFIAPIGMKVFGLIQEHAYWATLGEFDIVLYDSDDVELMSTSVDSSKAGLTNVFTQRSILFDAEVELIRDATYRLTFKPTTATVNTNTFYATVANSADIFSSQSRGGSNVHLTYRTDGGAWTDDIDADIGVAFMVSELEAASGLPQGLHAIEAGIIA